MTTHRPTSTTPTGLCSTAGALVALVAIAAMMSTATAAAPSAPIEARQTINEGAAVRAAVAAVAAAARELVGGQRLMHALPASWSVELSVRSTPSLPRVEDSGASPSIAALPERLLDLPPPRVG